MATEGSTATADATTSAQQPHWHKPTPENITHVTGLKVMNSLTRQKDEFVTMDGSNQIRWYMCGPTVYAPSHMGHARTYLGFDIIRKILTEYFHFDVTLIMNITDIDDKIIERSMEQGMGHLELSQKFEKEFHKDMNDLGVAPPNVLTRVTEFMQPVVDYIQKIIDQGFAYESNGSVYFNVTEFENNGKFHYCKLEPEQILNAKLLAEGEGKLSQTFVGDKRSPRDFALWKKSKEMEPSWPSPWGPGRPGWHIECSVMASDILQKLFDTNVMDIHSGGIDLKFPHHDNEMAQSEAHAGCTQWVNYFVHSGHLHIQGFKMSKSLKNFITIQQALENNSARQIRLLFLLHKYNAPMDYGDNTMSHAIVVEKQLTEFFLNVQATLRTTGNVTQVPQVWNDLDVQLQRTLQKSMQQVDAALKDDFDTPTTMSVLTDLIKATNTYLQSTKTPLGLVLNNVATFVTKILDVFGLLGLSNLGFEKNKSSKDSILEPVLDSLMQFRSNVRDQARAKDTGAVLKECDTFRDDVLPNLGIRLEDKSGGESVWKLVDAEELKREREQLELEKQRKQQEKEQAAKEKAAKDALNALPPAEFMKQVTLDDNTTLMYSKFGDDGLPTHMHDGEPLNKNQSKKAAKMFQGQQKKYEKYLKSQES